MKRFFEYILMGAGTAVGYFAITKLFKTWQDPVKKAALKKKAKNIKEAIFSKEEA